MHPIGAVIFIAMFVGGLSWAEYRSRTHNREACAAMSAVAIQTQDGLVCARVEIVGKP